MMKKEIEKRLGSYNEFPPNWKEITPDEYAVAMNANSIMDTDFRCMSDQHTKTGTNAVLIIFPDFTGVATTATYGKIGDDKQGHSRYGYKTGFYTFGCDHNFKTVPWNPKYGPRHMQERLERCSSCGTEKIINI